MDGGQETASFVLPADVTDAVKRLFADADRQGWRFQVFQERRKRARYWCPCDGHEIWFELYPKTTDYETRFRAHLRHTTCWEEAT